MTGPGQKTAGLERELKTTETWSKNPVNPQSSNPKSKSQDSLSLSDIGCELGYTLDRSNAYDRAYVIDNNKKTMNIGN